MKQVYLLGTDKNRLFLSVPMQFLAFQATKHAFLSGSHLKTSVFRCVLLLFAALLVGCASTSASAPSFSPAKESAASNVGGSPSANTVEVSGIEGHEWKLVEVHVGGKNVGFNRNTLPEAAANFFTLNFDAQNVSGVGAPNRYSAPYTKGNNQTVSIKLMRSTMMATFIVPENLNEQDYFIYLQNASSWKLANNSLELLSKTKDGGEVRLVFLP